MTAHPWMANSVPAIKEAMLRETGAPSIEALFELPFMELLFRAQQVHREPVTACVACQLAGCLGPCQPLRTSAGARLGNRPGQLRSSVADSPAHSLMAPLPALLWPPCRC